MSARENFKQAYASGKIKVNHDVEGIKATAERMKSLSKDELMSKLDDPRALLREFGFEIDDRTAAAIKERVDHARSGGFAQAAVIHVDV